MVRIREILDADLKAKVLRKLGEWRGTDPGTIPEWFELDDGDYSEILIAIRQDEDGEIDDYDARV